MILALCIAFSTVAMLAGSGVGIWGLLSFGKLPVIPEMQNNENAGDNVRRHVIAGKLIVAAALLIVGTIGLFVSLGYASA